MTHLRTYKSFNLQEIEEIESRIFGPNVPNENILKGCPGVMNIPNVQYESSSGSCGHPTRGLVGDACNWETVQDNIIRVLHHARNYSDPMIVHINERFIIEDELESYEESNVHGLLGKRSEMMWPKHMFPEVRSEEIQTVGDTEDLEIAIATHELDMMPNGVPPSPQRTGRLRILRTWALKCMCKKKVKKRLTTKLH